VTRVCTERYLFGTTHDRSTCALVVCCCEHTGIATRSLRSLGLKARVRGEAVSPGGKRPE
jgi:hypothetical protein